MPAKKFRFVSPGVQVKEIDKSQISRLPAQIGPVVIGRTLRGPGMVPVTVGSYEEFVEKFGTPDRGVGNTDVWRNGNTTAPLYASYAAEAWLKNSTPLTMVRLLGTQDSNATTTGYAGWATANQTTDTNTAQNGGAYGLWVIPSGSSYASTTGSLAAVFYLNEGGVRLVGNIPGGSTLESGSGVLIQSNGDDFGFRMQIVDASTGSLEDVTFNFNPNSSKFIRKVFNTNPTLTNATITDSTIQKTYWLGETFETFLSESLSGSSASAQSFAFIGALESGSVNLGDHENVQAQPGKTGWIIGQDLNANTGSYSPTNMTKLFRLVASEGLGGDWEQNNVKVSILDIKPPVNQFEKYGTFTVAVRKIDDLDSNPEFLEVFAGCNLDPSSPNFVAARIGDRRMVWSESEKRHKEYGDYPNLSRYVRVELSPAVEQGGVEPALVPFGFFGPPRLSSVTVNNAGNIGGSQFLKVANGVIPLAPSASLAKGDITPLNVQLDFPRMKLLVSSSQAGVPDITQAYFGIIPNAGLIGSPQARLSEDFVELTRAKVESLNSYDPTGSLEASFIFSLDDVVVTSSATLGTYTYWSSGSRAAGDSLTAKSGSYTNILDQGHDRFTMPLFGGDNGLDITEKEPFRNTRLDDNGGTAVANYAANSLFRAIDSVKDPEVLDMNLLVLPGVTHEPITKYAMDICEQRGDALAIIDLKGGYQPTSEDSSSEETRIGSVSTTISNIKARNLNTSYGCAYYPWVKVLDTESGAPMWMPPSVVALGTMASSQERSEVWFAPAGFNRGGLSLGSSGLSVVGVREKLSAKQRDALYEVNINPIASFPSEGIVIFGQKTLQATPSALDRINVRRLVIFLKKQMSILAAGLLFEPNVENTWNRFRRPATSILESVKNGFGISDYKLVLDRTTTTPEEIDRNMMYAKLFIKPVYAIEFIGIDFVITNTGASFEDL
jgi:hypothetical protein